VEGFLVGGPVGLVGNQPDGLSRRGMPLLLFAQKDNLMACFSQGRSQAPELGREIGMGEEDPHRAT